MVHIFQYGPITNDETTDVIPDYAALKKAGAFALSNDGHGVQTAQTMYLAMQKAKENNLIIATHAQDDSLFNKGIVNEGPKAKELNLPPVTELAETTQIARDLLLAQKRASIIIFAMYQLKLVWNWFEWLRRVESMLPVK